MSSSRTSLIVSRTPHSERTLEMLAADSLRKHDSVLPRRPGPVLIDRLVEEMFGFNETYESLDRGILGEIHFGMEDRPVAIRIARRLGDLNLSISDGVDQERRVTIAHECGHGIAHSKLFADSLRRERAPLLPGFANGQIHIACRERDLAVGARPAANSTVERWLEWEANYLMGALLLPRHLLLELISPWLAGTADGISPRYLPAPRRHAAITATADTFNVTLALAAQRLALIVPAARHPDFFDSTVIENARYGQPGTRLRNQQNRRAKTLKIWSK